MNGDIWSVILTKNLKFEGLDFPAIFFSGCFGWDNFSPRWGHTAVAQLGPLKTGALWFFCYPPRKKKKNTHTHLKWKMCRYQPFLFNSRFFWCSNFSTSKKRPRFQDPNVFPPPLCLAAQDDRNLETVQLLHLGVVDGWGRCVMLELCQVIFVQEKLGVVVGLV